MQDECSKLRPCFCAELAEADGSRSLTLCQQAREQLSWTKQVTLMSTHIRYNLIAMSLILIIVTSVFDTHYIEQPQKMIFLARKHKKCLIIYI